MYAYFLKYFTQEINSWERNGYFKTAKLDYLITALTVTHISI